MFLFLNIFFKFFKEVLWVSFLMVMIGGIIYFMVIMYGVFYYECWNFVLLFDFKLKSFGVVVGIVVVSYLLQFYMLVIEGSMKEF